MNTEAAMGRRPKRKNHEPDAFSRLLEAAIACADAEENAEFENAKNRLTHAAIWYAKHRRRRRVPDRAENPA